MRILFTIIIVTILFSCNNNLTTIGQDMIDNGTYVEMEKYTIDEVSTIKIDSFVTSSGYATGNYALTELLMGKFNDRYSGTTTAIPCFQIVPSTQPLISETFTLDSVTLNFNYAGSVWGDTITPSLQKFYLYRLDTTPELDKNDDYIFYNNYPLPRLKDKLAEVNFYPLAENMQKAYFKLSEGEGLKWAQEMFDAMVHPGKDNIFNDIPWSFINVFKGLAIIPDVNNNCILSIKSTSDNLYMRFHFHKTEDESYYDIPLGMTEYMYNSINSDLQSSAYFGDLHNQQDAVSFETAGVSVIQGVAGLMTKMILPKLPYIEQYTTILKAEIELTPEIFVRPEIAMPAAIGVYKTNSHNDIKGMLYNNLSAGTVVQGIYTPDPANNANYKYIFDVTDYYQRMSTGSLEVETDYQVLLTVPNLSSSYDQAVIVEKPVLRVYYAKYRNE